MPETAVILGVIEIAKALILAGTSLLKTQGKTEEEIEQIVLLELERFKANRPGDLPDL